jgi:ankyrin repeat protein
MEDNTTCAIVLNYLQIAGTTPLMRAAKTGHQECVKLMINNGAHVDMRDANGMTAAEWSKKITHEDLTNKPWVIKFVS